MDKDEFIKKAKMVQDKEYDYSKVEYKGNKIKVKIICPIHGVFEVRPNDFLSGHMCKFCGIEKRKEKRVFTTDEFINKARKIFPQYDYSLVKYINTHEKIKIICPIHGEFEIKPYHLLNGHGCKKCGIILGHNKQRKCCEDFIAQARKIHGDKYDYSKVEYVNNYTKVCIICPTHGEFWQTPHAHLAKQGCPYCNESVLEREIALFLEDNNIMFERKKQFVWLGLQHLDFYLPKYKIGIECQGIQHFEVVDYFGGKKGFKDRQERDKRKQYLCDENNVKLLHYSFLKHDGIITNKKELLKEIINGKKD